MAIEVETGIVDKTEHSKYKDCCRNIWALIDSNSETKFMHHYY